MNELLAMLKYCATNGISLILSKSKQSYWTPQVALVQQHIDKLNELSTPIGFEAKIIKGQFNPNTGDKSPDSAYIGPVTTKQMTVEELAAGIILKQ
tara:strand:+ start:285 stop:572 length:288 start_codon:yes stop_codon:yes gene_type:complete